MSSHGWISKYEDKEEHAPPKVKVATFHPYRVYCTRETRL